MNLVFNKKYLRALTYLSLLYPVASCNYRSDLRSPTLNVSVYKSTFPIANVGSAPASQSAEFTSDWTPQPLTANSARGGCAGGGKTEVDSADWPARAKQSAASKKVLCNAKHVCKPCNLEQESRS